MKLVHLRISNFQCFGPGPTTISLEPMTFLLGPNGAGKTAVLQALNRMFGFERSLRGIRPSDFHVSQKDLTKAGKGADILWIEAQFEFPELKETTGKYAAIPAYFAHMQLISAAGVPRVRFRLQAQFDEDGEIDETFFYVIETDANDEPAKTVTVSKHDRNSIQVHYLPARRDPADHVTYAASSLLGRALRSANWATEHDTVSTLAQGISDTLGTNPAIQEIGKSLTTYWAALHKGTYYEKPNVSFEYSEIDKLLRQLTIGFTPGHVDTIVNFSRLSDGQKSLLYVSLVLSLQAIGRQVLAKQSSAFDVDKLRPALFTMMAMEEPENSLSPHYLGRMIKSLTEFSSNTDAQSIVATHASSLLKRTLPENIRYLRLSSQRETIVKSIIMPDATDEAYKFVREGVQAFPELYFSRLVILGEGDSEEIILQRLLQSKGLGDDDAAISIVPLGGRHVNHFWRLLEALDIPHVTLLDLDLGRHQGGWGRVKYAAQQLLKFPPPNTELGPQHVASLPEWNSDQHILTLKTGQDWIAYLESQGVFFSSPLDLDFAMIQQLPAGYDIELAKPDDAIIVSVLGKSHGDVSQYSAKDQEMFRAYHRKFKLGSKPTAHLNALAQLDDAQLNKNIPQSLERLLNLIKAKLKDIPE
jgi:putative ATP-dependent endonuclease of the OLD family